MFVILPFNFSKLILYIKKEIFLLKFLFLNFAIKLNFKKIVKCRKGYRKKEGKCTDRD